MNIVWSLRGYTQNVFSALMGVGCSPVEWVRGILGKGILSIHKSSVMTYLHHRQRDRCTASAIHPCLWPTQPVFFPAWDKYE